MASIFANGLAPLPTSKVNSTVSCGEKSGGPARRVQTFPYNDKIAIATQAKSLSVDIWSTIRSPNNLHMKLNKTSLLQQGTYIQKMTAQSNFQRLAKSLRSVKTRFELQRYGGVFDGGYLMAEDFEGIKTCFSPGVDINASFELDIKNRLGIESHLADYSVDGPPMSLTPKSFLKKYIGAFDNEVYTTLDTWVRGTDDFRSGEDMLSTDGY